LGFLLWAFLLRAFLWTAFLAEQWVRSTENKVERHPDENLEREAINFGKASGIPWELET
jgi:hypothetical protein